MRSPLSRERWIRVENLFVAAAELPPDRRRQFVEEQSQGDDELRNEVFSLLRYDTSGPDIQEAVELGARSILTHVPLEGTLLGPWRVERELGRGGMSVVYLAVRADGQFSKRVAIKVIKRGMDTAAVVERFQRERRILAALDHPYIARLLDGGTTADGLPYIVMDYVEGLPIDHWCAERGLGVEQRCELIGKVCEAVAYAHRNLVIHRDLKPGNILVGADGNPKLLDFGIAKLLGDGAETGGEAETRVPMRPLTPEYASPEQMSGGVVGTATDVYSLGVVLFELLAGTRPQNEGDKASAVALRCGKGARWSRAVAGDLDNILQMTLRAEPERRYLGAGQLQEDLRRHLAGQPVAARRETWGYRCAKFYRRHPFGTPAVALVALLAVTGVVFIVQAERDASAQRQKAEERLGQLVDLSNRVLFGLHGSIERLPGATEARLDIVQSTLEYLDKLNAEDGNDPRILSALASAYARVARAQGSPQQPNLGDLKGAQRSYEKAGRILAQLMKGNGGGPDLLEQDAELRLEYGLLLSETGHRDNAVTEFRGGLGRLAILLGKYPHSLPARRTRSRLQLEIGQVTKYTDPAATRTTDLALVPEFETLVRENPGDTDCLLNLASLWSQVGSTFDEEGKPADAVDGFRRSLALREQVFALRPRDVQVQRDLLIAYGHLGDITGSPMFPSKGDYREAIVLYRKAAAIAHAMGAADPSNVQARNDEGTALFRVGASQTAAGDNRLALESLRQSEVLLEPLRAASPGSVPLAQRVSLLQLYRGRALLNLGEYPAATATLRRSAGLCIPVLKIRKDSTCQHNIWIAQQELAQALVLDGAVPEGLKELQDAFDSMQLPENAGDTTIRLYLARGYQAAGLVHATLAKRVDGTPANTEWRLAADSYRQARELWNMVNPGTEPFLSDRRTTDAELAEAEGALRGK